MNALVRQNVYNLAATAAYLAVSSVAAQADVKIVSEVTVQKSSDTETHQTITISYQGTKARVEIDGAPITIYDMHTSKIYTVYTDQKTYRVRSLKMLWDIGGATPRQMPIPLKTEAHLDAKIQEDSKNISERKAHKYLLTGSARLVADVDGGFPGGGGPGNGGFPGGPGGVFPGGSGPPGGGFPGGGAPPGGGFPGGGGSPRGGKMPELPRAEMEGELWVSDGMPALSKANRSKLALLPSYTVVLPSGPLLSALVKSLTEKMAKSQGIPLSSKLTVVTPKMAAPARDGRGPGQAETEAEQIVITTEVKAVSEDALDSSLFAVPDGYKEINAPGERKPPKR